MVEERKVEDVGRGEGGGRGGGAGGVEGGGRGGGGERWWRSGRWWKERWRREVVGTYVWECY